MVLMDHLLRSEFATNTDFDAYSSELKKDLEGMEFRLRAEMASGFAKTTRTFVVSQVVLVVAMIGSLTGAIATLAH